MQLEANQLPENKSKLSAGPHMPTGGTQLWAPLGRQPPPSRGQWRPRTEAASTVLVPAQGCSWAIFHQDPVGWQMWVTFQTV